MKLGYLPDINKINEWSQDHLQSISELKEYRKCGPVKEKCFSSKVAVQTMRNKSKTNKSKSKWNSKLSRTTAGLTSNTMKSYKKKRQKGRATKNLAHIVLHIHCRREKPPSRGRRHVHSVSIKWEPVSHFIITPHIPPWKAGLLGEASSFTAMLKHRMLILIHSKICEWEERKIGKYLHKIQPQLEHSTLALLIALCYSGKWINQ